MEREKQRVRQEREQGIKALAEVMSTTVARGGGESDLLLKGVATVDYFDPWHATTSASSARHDGESGDGKAAQTTKCQLHSNCSETVEKIIKVVRPFREGESERKKKLKGAALDGSYAYLVDAKFGQLDPLDESNAAQAAAERLTGGEGHGRRRG